MVEPSAFASHQPPSSPSPAVRRPPRPATWPGRSSYRCRGHRIDTVSASKLPQSFQGAASIVCSVHEPKGEHDRQTAEIEIPSAVRNAPERSCDGGDGGTAMASSSADSDKSGSADQHSRPQDSLAGVFAGDGADKLRAGRWKGSLRRPLNVPGGGWCRVAGGPRFKYRRRGRKSRCIRRGKSTLIPIAIIQHVKCL